MSSPPTLDVAAGEGVEDQPVLPLDPPPSPLPPPPPPLAQPSIAIPPAAPALAPSSPYFPFNDPTILFFLDPFSPEAQDLKKTFEITSQAFGQTFPSTTDARLASHLVLDPSCDANQFIRRLAPEKVVSLQWLKDGFMKLAPPSENGYRLGEVEEKQEEVEGVREREQEREEDDNEDAASSSSLHPLSDYVNPKYASRGGWLKSEEETFARFLASDPRPDENGRSIWDQYHLTHPSRSAQSYKKHYNDRKDVYFDLKVAELGEAFDDQLIAPSQPQASVSDARFVKGYSTFAGWLVEEEEDLARFLASNPQKNDKGTIWQQYQRSHPYRTSNAYYERHRIRKEEYFDTKVAELKEANSGRPIEYKHPEVEVNSEDEREDAPFAGPRSLTNRTQVAQLPPPPPRPKTSGFCSNCHVDAASYWSKIEGKGEKSFCGGCRSAWYTAKKKGPRAGSEGLAHRRRIVLGPQKGESSSTSSSSSGEDSSDSDAPDLDLGNVRPHHPSNSKSPSSSVRSRNDWSSKHRKDLLLLLIARTPAATFVEVEKNFRKQHPHYSVVAIQTHYRHHQLAYDQAVRTARSQGPDASVDSLVPVSGHSGSVRWTSEEDGDLAGMLARRKGSKVAVYNAFSEKHPRRPSSTVLAHYQDHKKRIDAEIAALQRKEWKQSKREPAVSGSEELEEDDSMGDDEDSDDEEMDLQTPTSAPSSSSLFVGRKRPQESQQGASSKRTKVDSPFNAVASPSKTSSSSSHHHQHRSHYPDFSHNYSSGSSGSLNQPHPLLPSFTRRVAPVSTSSAHSEPHSDGALHDQPLSPPPPPPAPEVDSSSEEKEDLEPESFLTLGAKPTSCPPGAPCCWFCGFFDEDGVETFKNLPLAERNLESGEVERVMERLACGVCETTWERRFVRKLKLDEGVAEMGELERLAWVTGVVFAKGKKARRERVYGRKAAEEEG